MKETLLDGRYQLLDALGSGGEARVFRARDNSTGWEVAVRLALNPTTYTAPQSLPDFHPGWVRLLDSGIDPQHGPCQIFELLQGETLRQMVISSGPMEREPWRLFVDQSLAAVKALHDAGWVHGDLNGDNFVQTPGPRWKLLELPFLRFDPPQGRTALFGSIYTLAPEQLDGTQADARSDFYALGCVYYFAACGEFPHAAASSREMAVNRLRFDPAPLALAEKASRLPVSWSTWVMTLLSRNPEKRIRTALEDERV
jgi:serine/threonine protein kinase